MSYSIAGVVLALLTVACTPGNDAIPPTPAGAGTTAVSASPDSSAGRVDPPECGDQGYVSDGPIARLGSESGDAAQILGIGLTSIGDCERVTVQFATRGGAPATRLPETQVEWLEDVGVLRITLSPDVQSTALADTVLEGRIADRTYVVRSFDGGLFIDVTVRTPAEVRVEATRSPARLLMEFRAAESSALVSPAIGRSVVVTAPVAGPVPETLVVTGYARTAEGRVVGRLVDGSGQVEERMTTAAAHIETWGAFRLTFESVPDGPFELLVGGESSDDPAGVTLSLHPG